MLLNVMEIPCQARNDGESFKETFCQGKSTTLVFKEIFRFTKALHLFWIPACAEMTQGGGNDEMDRAKRRGIFVFEPIKCLTVKVPRRFARSEQGVGYPIHSSTFFIRSCAVISIFMGVREMKP
jgi:hypothetical protein